MCKEIRILSARLAVLEAWRRRDPEGGDDNEEEVAATMDGSNEEGPYIKLLSFVLLVSIKPKPELSNYDDNLSTEVLLDWITEFNK